MALEYNLEFVDEFTALNLVVNNDNTNPFRISIENTDVIKEIEKLPLYKSETFTITFWDIYNVNYNSVELYNKKWLGDDRITISGKELFRTLKSNVNKLYKLLQDDNNFKLAMNVYLKASSNSGELDKSNYFPSLLAKRHTLYKIATLLYISFTVAEQTMCKTEETQELDYQKAKKRYNGLSKLLQDTTNLLLNIDVINKNPSVINARNVISLTSPPNTT